MSCPNFSAQGLRESPSLLIREARKKADLTRAALAARLRISPASIASLRPTLCPFSFPPALCANRGWVSSKRALVGQFYAGVDTTLR